MKHNVLFGAYPWAFDCPGGGERQLMAWKAHLEKQDHTVTLYDPWKPIPNQTKIFHFFSVMAGSYQLCDYMKNKGLKLVISPNLWVTPETKWEYPHDEIQRILSITDMVIANSQLEADTLGEVYGLPPERFHVAYNGVEESFLETANQTAFREQFKLGKRKFLLNIANVEPRKNQLNFLKALKHHPDLSLVVIGNARIQSYLEECQKLGGEQFIFVGSLDYGSEMIRSAIAGAEGFVMPSTLETPSIAALEAAASGTKILITNVGSTTEYFSDHAIYIDPNIQETMVEGIAALLANTTNCMHQVIQDKFTWIHSTNQLVQAYQKVLTQL
jgi:glycosyltransferase involved in cell wall biosynthesis